MPTKLNDDDISTTSPISLEIAFDRVVCRWDKSLKTSYNPIDEELILRVLDSNSLVVLEHRIEHLSQKELLLSPGHYRLEIARFFRQEVELRSPLYKTPTLTWNQDSKASSLLTWSGLDWEAIRHEVVKIYDLDWDKDVTVALRVLWSRAEGLSSEWISVPNRQHISLQGKVEEVELAVISKKEQKILKSLFLAKLAARSPLQVLASHPLALDSAKPYLRLQREIIESDSLQLRASWGGFPQAKYRLSLWKDSSLLESHEPVSASGNWLFNGLHPGTYEVTLEDTAKKSATSKTSTSVTFSESKTEIKLLPINERRAFAYWHVAPKAWDDLSQEHGSLEGRVRAYLQLAIQAGGELRTVSELTRPIDVGSTSDYYLDLAPDRVYKARIIAVLDEGKRYPITDWSNPCQLGRLGPGSNRITHKKEWQSDSHPSVRAIAGPTAIAYNSIGHLIVHLHAHLPFIADPINFGQDTAWRPVGYPQEWYPEAVCDTYLPLLDTLETLREERIDFKLSMDISPPLAAMMTSQRHASDVLAYLDRLIKLARLEVERTGWEQPYYRAAALMHFRRYHRCRDLFLGYDGDIARAFARLQDLGYLEISSCVGTHPMLPLWLSQPSAIRGHCLAAAESHQEIFGRPSAGVWLPECAYTPGIEPYLEQAGFKYTFGESHCISRGDSPAEFGVNAPVYCKGSQLAIFPRDPETGEQVWSGDQGYPGDPDYLEFHIRGGPFKYNRITDRRGGDKEPYNPQWAENKAAEHAGHFLWCRNRRFEFLRHTMWKKPLITAPYDAELFGHHWYEGPRFLYYLFKKIHYDQSQTELTTPSSYLAGNPTNQDMYCNVSSWGDKGTFEKWMYGSTSWMYRHAHEAANLLSKLCSQGIENQMQHRILAQAARQLMIASSSDLPFVISNGHFIDRMKDQFFSNLRAFYDLCEAYQRCRKGEDIEPGTLRSLELENCLIPSLDPKWFA